jgi:hypothetical protein
MFARGHLDLPFEQHLLVAKAAGYRYRPFHFVQLSRLDGFYLAHSEYFAVRAHSGDGCCRNVWISGPQESETF